MRHTTSGIRSWKLAFAALGMASIAVTTGCQADYNGQTLPSGYYLHDDIQYFPAGPEFKLSKEAAAMKAYREEQAEIEGPAPEPQQGPAPGQF